MSCETSKTGIELQKLSIVEVCVGCGRPVAIILAYGHAPGCQWCEDCTEAPQVFPIRAA